MAYPDHVLCMMAMAGHDYVEGCVARAPWRERRKVKRDCHVKLMVDLYGGLPGERTDLPGNKVSLAERQAPFKIEAALALMERSA